MSLRYIAFDDSYRAAYRQVSRVVRHDELVVTCGQLDADGAGIAQNIGDITAQTERSVDLVYDAIQQAGASTSDLLKLQVFYRAASEHNATSYERFVRELLPNDAMPVINYTPIASFPKGVEVEIDGVAAIGAGTGSIERAALGQCEAISYANSVFVSAVLQADTVPEAMQLLSDLTDCLAGVGAAMTNLRRLRFYQRGLSDTPGKAERVIAQTLAKHALVYTRLPLVSSSDEEPILRLEFEGTAAPSDSTQILPQSREDASMWGLGYARAVRDGNTIFVGGQVPYAQIARHRESPTAMTEQINTVMRGIQNILGHYDADFNNVAKVNAYYAGQDDLETWASNVQSRCDFYPQPGPASTGVEVLTVGLSPMRVCVDCLAFVD